MNWKDLIDCLPPGLTFSEAAKRLGKDYQAVRYAIIRHGYPAADGRRFSQNASRALDPAKVDWSLSNIEIARRLGISKQRVSKVRKQLNLPLVESRGRKKGTTTHATRPRLSTQSSPDLRCPIASARNGNSQSGKRSERKVKASVRRHQRTRRKAAGCSP